MTMRALTPSQLIACATGCSDDHLVDIGRHRLHAQITDDFKALQQGAKNAGFSLAIASSFRDFNRQSAIWNAKFSGKRPVFNKQQVAIDLSTLTDIDKCHAILLYSALPGASRHHLGTDIDVYDEAAIAADYELQLSPYEYSEAGPFALLTAWLDKNLKTYGFYRPYQEDLGGVSPEPWHISHIKQSQIMCNQITLEVIENQIKCSDLLGKETIVKHLPSLFSRYVTNVAPVPI